MADLAAGKPMVPENPVVALEKVPWIASVAPSREKPVVVALPSATKGPMLSESMEKFAPERSARPSWQDSPSKSKYTGRRFSMSSSSQDGSPRPVGSR